MVVNGVIEPDAHHKHVPGDGLGNAVDTCHGTEPDGRCDQRVLDHVLTGFISYEPGQVRNTVQT